MTFPVKGDAWTLAPDRLATYVRAFPALDVPQELSSARLWLVDHPRRLKTPSGMGRFLTGWLRRSNPPRPIGAAQMPYTSWRCPHREADDTPVHSSPFRCQQWDDLQQARQELAEARAQMPLEPGGGFIRNRRNKARFH
jgi:hypothetical protein